MPSDDEPTISEDLQTLATAIQALDDLTHHRPDGLAMKAQAALDRLILKLRPLRDE